ncbi:LLM class F420-dependent oxidoreductase [Pseudonocardia aurantiaca]|uniref:TIGR03617 family F420-dependent LLM class oxidoreductase n=1 Tax=Pseudonocardia aurantiaca TaxID=75290 RepID=A0ABW4FNF7_9PSEU
MTATAQGTDPLTHFGTEIALGYHTVAISPTELAAVAADVEELGIDSLWMAETKHDPFVGLAVAAALTSRVSVNTGLAVAFARNPMTVAVAANDLQLLSGGRFGLGLGSQMKTHITRRFGMPWSNPAARMREFVLAVRAIWRAFETGERLRFRGEFYRHTLMDPFFDPGPNPHGNPPIMLAGVGELMTAVAGEVADGYLAHTIATRRYLESTALPLLRRGRAAAGRTMEGFALHVTPIVVTGATEEEFAASVRFAKEQIAKYAAIPTYSGILEGEGLGAVRDEMQLLAAQGRWTEMPALVDDTVLDAFAVVGEPAEIGVKLQQRFGHLATSIALYQYSGGSPRDLVPAYSRFRAAQAARP